MKNLLNLVIIVALTGCGVVDGLHNELDCALAGENCPVRSMPKPVEPKTCHTETTDLGVSIICSDSYAFIPYSNMEYNIAEIVELCEPGGEVLLRLSNNQLLAVYFKKKKYAYMTVIGPGSYVTTDGENCHFQVTQDLEIL